jgi:hypothetical protein
MPTEPEHLTTSDRLRKLRAMSAGEVWTRIRYDLYCSLERRRHARGKLAAPERLRRALTGRLRRGADWKRALLEARRATSGRFFAGVEHLDATRALLAERFLDELQAARAEAERVHRHEFAFFGSVFRYNGQVDWHADPVTGAQWPRRYHRDMPVHGGDAGFGDVKYVWELGRHQFLIDLAKGWAIDRRPQYAASTRDLMQDWRVNNPVGTGVAWSCALEPAFRSLSWLWAYYLTRDDPAMSDESHLWWLEGFFDHGSYLYRHLEYYSSPFNHLMGEACALYSLGVLFPEFDEAPKWRAHGRELLEDRLGQQFYEDGGSVEQSTFYHHATTGFYLLSLLIGRQNGDEFSPAVWKAVERALEFSMHLQQPDGSTPRIGGADDGKPIRVEHRPLWDFRPYLAIGAVLFDREDFKFAAGRFFEDALWLLGPDGARHFDSIGTSEPLRSVALPRSGYVVMRDRWAPDGDYVCFDCGEQAGGLRRDNIPSAAHGHADCLSIIVWRGGRPILIDPGFHCYNGPKEWQDHFRETASHSTIRIDGRDQARHINKMAWSNTYTAILENHDFAAPSPWAMASHDGFRSLERGAVTHRRVVWVRCRGYAVVADFLEGTGEHDVELTYQFAPGTLSSGDGQASFGGDVDLRWFGSSRLVATVFEGGPQPHEGWIAPSLGVKLAAPRLVLATRTSVPATFITILLDRSRQVLEATRDQKGVIRVDGEGWSERLTVHGLSDGPEQKDGVLLAAWRDDGGRQVLDGKIGRPDGRT